MSMANSGSVGRGKGKIELTEEEAMSLINQVGPSLGCGDHTYHPIFPEGRKDVCAVRRMAENGNDYGFDTIYLVWKEKDGQICYRELVNSKYSKDYIGIDSITVKGNNVVVKYSSGGSFSGNPWESQSQTKLKQGDDTMGVANIGSQGTKPTTPRKPRKPRR